MAQQLTASPWLHRIFTSAVLCGGPVRVTMRLRKVRETFQIYRAYRGGDMKTTFKKVAAALSVVVTGALLAATASAQCGNPTGAKLHRQAWRVGDPAASLILAAEAVDPIVGMWQVKFISEGNAGITDGTVIDNT